MLKINKVHLQSIENFQLNYQTRWQIIFLFHSSVYKINILLKKGSLIQMGCIPSQLPTLSQKLRSNYNPTPDSRINYEGDVYMEFGEYQLAAQKYQRVINIWPKNRWALRSLPQCLYKLKKYDETILACKNFLLAHGRDQDENINIARMKQLIESSQMELKGKSTDYILIQKKKENERKKVYKFEDNLLNLLMDIKIQQITFEILEKERIYTMETFLQLNQSQLQHIQIAFKDRQKIINTKKRILNNSQ